MTTEKLPRSPVTFIALGLLTIAIVVLGFASVSLVAILDLKEETKAAKASTEANKDLLNEVVELNNKVTNLIEAENAEDAGRQKRLTEALAAVEALEERIMAKHDMNLSQKLNEILHHLNLLLADRGFQGVASSPPAQVNIGPSRTKSTLPPSLRPRVTTTTSPDQKSCTKRADGPRC